MSVNNSFAEIRKSISRQRKIINEIISLSKNLSKINNMEEKRMINSQINSLKDSLKNISTNVSKIVKRISLAKPLTSKIQPPYLKSSNKPQPVKIKPEKKLLKNLSKEVSELEKIALKRLKKSEKKILKEKIKKPSKYIKTSNNLFLELSNSLINKKMFKKLKKDLIKANFQLIPASYISVIFFTTLLSFVAAIFIFIFFLFFNLSAKIPFIINMTESLGIRFLKTFWILFIVPIITFITMSFYPTLEKKSVEGKIDRELPFATINMSAISGSMINPSKIFSIIITTKEYPNLEKEFTKLMNEINIYGYDLVSALRNIGKNSPSAKLTELFNGLATTINSGGDLPSFFDKRAQSLLFEYKIDREKQAKFAETFMDIYISVVIAAPMILMLLMMMMKISGLGISLSTSMIALIMVLGVIMINILFLTFLHLKQPRG